MQEQAEKALCGNGLSPTLTDAEQTAKLVCVPPSWLKKQAKDGHIPHLKIGNKRMFSVVAVRQRIEQMAFGYPEEITARQRVRLLGEMEQLKAAEAK